jgi:hypothetical protein
MRQRSKTPSWRESAAAIERVQEYLRQRKLQNKDLGTTIHNVYTDPDAEMASLTIEDIEAVLSRLQRVETALTNRQRDLQKYEG